MSASAIEKMRLASLEAFEELFGDEDAKKENEAPKKQKTKTSSKDMNANKSNVIDLDYVENEDEILDRCIDHGSSLMSPEVGRFLKRKCQVQASRGLTQEAAKTLMRAQGLSFLHQANVQLHKRIARKVEEKVDGDKDMFEEDSLGQEEIQKRLLGLQSRPLSEDKITEVVENLPKEWKVVQINSQPFLQV